MAISVPSIPSEDIATAGMVYTTTFTLSPARLNSNRRECSLMRYSPQMQYRSRCDEQIS